MDSKAFSGIKIHKKFKVGKRAFFVDRGGETKEMIIFHYSRSHIFSHGCSATSRLAALKPKLVARTWRIIDEAKLLRKPQTLEAWQTLNYESNLRQQRVMNMFSRAQSFTP